MANSSLFNALNGNKPTNRIAQLMQDVRQFQKTFSGDPKAEVQKMLNDGRLSQAQFNEYAQMANQIMSAMGGKF